MNPTRLFLIRHGEVAPEAQGCFNGHSDVGLSDEGRAQFRRLRNYLADEPIDAVYSSDLARCREGAREIARDHALPLQIRPALRELHFGQWEGQCWADIEARYPEQIQARLADPLQYVLPGGESLAQLLQRLRPVREEILRDHVGETVVIVAHGGVNRALLLDVVGAPMDRLFSLDQSYGCCNRITYYPDGTGVIGQLNYLPGATADA